MSFHNHVALDFPVSLGGYNHPRDPAEPIVLHMVHVPGLPNSGLDARWQFRVGRARLYPYAPRTAMGRLLRAEAASLATLLATP